MLLIWSAGSGVRYVFPVIPLFFFYLVTAIAWLSKKIAPLLCYSIAAGWAGLVFICFISTYSAFSRAPIAGGILTPGFMDVCRYVKTNTKADDVFIICKPRVFSLYTNRPASVYLASGGPELTYDYCRRIHVAYVISGDCFDTDRSMLMPFLNRYSDRLKLAYRSYGFSVYRVNLSQGPPIALSEARMAKYN